MLVFLRWLCDVSTSSFAAQTGTAHGSEVHAGENDKAAARRDRAQAFSEAALAGTDRVPDSWAVKEPGGITTPE